MTDRRFLTSQRVGPALLILFAVACQIVLSYAIVSGHLTIIALALAAVVALVMLALPTERALLVVFGYAAFHGLAKLFTNYQPVVYASLDLLFLLLLANWVLRERWRADAKWPPALLPIALFVIWTLLILLAPISNIVIGLGSLKSYILPIGLYFVAYRTLQSRDQLQRFFALTVTITAIMAVFAIVQHQLGPKVVASWGPGFARTINSSNQWYSPTLAAPVFRPFSTTPDPYAAALYMMIGVLATLAILRPRQGERRWLLPVAGALLLAGYAMTLLVIGVRQVWYETVIGVVVLAICGGVSASGARSLLLALALAITFAVSSVAVGDRLASVSQPLDAYVTERGGYMYLILPSIEQFPFGRGLGTAGVAPDQLQRIFGLTDAGTFIGADNMFLVMVYESGVVGLALFVLLNVTLLVCAFRALRQLRDPRLRALGAGLFAIMIAVVATYFGGGAFMTTPSNYYFWFAAGALMKLPAIACQEQADRDQEA